MESIKYVFKEIKSVPIYNADKDSYDVLIEDELVEIPAELFFKLFKEHKKDKKTKNSDLLTIKYDFSSKSKSDDIIEDVRDSIKFLKKMNIPKNLIMTSIKETIGTGKDLKDFYSKFEDMIDKVYEDE